MADAHGGHEARWRVELSRAAVSVLRALPRARQRAVAERIAQLERTGPPLPRESQPIELATGGETLVCAAYPDERRVVVVTLVPEAASPLRALARLALRRLRGWWGGGGAEPLREARLAARSLVRSPAFTAGAVVTLALGIGASTAVFSVADGVLLEPLPYGEPDRIVTVWSRWSQFPKTWVSEEEYANYWQQNRTLQDLALYFNSTHTFTSPTDPEQVPSAVVTANTFEVLGVEPAVGRAFSWEEAAAEAPVVLLGHDVWERRFASDRSLVGRAVEINGVAYTVLGVLPQSFRLPIDYGSTGPSQIFFAAPLEREAPAQVPENGGSHGYYAVGRLAEGMTVEEARADLEGIAARLAAQGVYDASWAFRPLVLPVAEDIVGSARTSILFLLGACALVLLIACGNVANLLLSRGAARDREIALRRALGASTGTILRGLLLENAILAAAGGALGLLLGQLGLSTLLAIDPGAVPRASGVGLDGRVVAFAVATSALTTVFFGWIPALRLATGRMALRGRFARAGAGRTQRILVAGQMAMAVVLLAAAGLAVRTFTALSKVDLGLRADRVLTAQLTVPSASYPEHTDLAGFWDELLRRVRGLPGVEAAGAVRLLPLDTQAGDAFFRPLDYMPAPRESPGAEWQFVTAGYVEAMGIPIVAGRAFDERDIRGAATAMMINQGAARRYWGAADPIGSRTIAFGGDTAVVVGVVGDVRHNGVTAEVKPVYYRALPQLSGPGTVRRMTLVVEAEGDARALAGPVRAILRELDPRIPLARARTMDEVVSAAYAPARFTTVLVGAFAALAVALAAIGVYGVLAHAVSLRTREIGVRMALGAERSGVTAMVVRQGMGMALVGVAAGMAGALAVARSMGGLLYGVPPRDPVTFAAVPLLFTAVALLACWIPARRAARIEPAEALRRE